MSRRVVVTGVGLLTSVGIGTEAVWAAIKKGENGIAPITAFDPTCFNCRIAGEVKNFAVTPGEHRVTVRVPHRQAVADVTFEVHEREIIFLECAPRGGPFSALLRLVLRGRRTVDLYASE